MNENLAALVPPVVVLLLFLLVIRAFVTADRRERKARERIDAEIRRRRENSDND
jgi:hypothetical protein